MLILLPPATFIAVFLGLNGYHSRQLSPLTDWRTSFLQSATILGGYMVLFSELLSLFHALTTLWVALFWGLALVMAILLGWKKGWISEGIDSLKAGWKKPDWFDILAGTILTIILVLLFFVAIKSPVNNNDSLQYHMSRVMHWVQDQGLQHYATAYVPQLVTQISAELNILQFRLLWGNDQFANLVQYLSLLGILVGVAAIIALFGQGRKIQWLAIAFCISLPMGILQATSTQNDLVTAFWLTTLAYFTIIAVKREIGWLEIATFGICLGMGMQTKGTFFPFAFPLVIWFFFARLIHRPIVQILKIGILITVLAFIFSSGYWFRNIATYGGIFGPKDWVTAKTSQRVGVGPLSGALIRNAVINFSTPDDDINKHMVLILRNTFKNIDPAMAELDISWAWNHEDLAGNPIQLGLIFASFLLIFIKRRNITDRTVLGLAIALAGMYLMYSLIIAYDGFGIRYELPWFIVSAPLFAIAFSLINDDWLPLVLTLLLLLSAFPWILFNRTRPLIAMRDSNDPYTIPCLAGCTAGSILNEPPEKTMFAVWGSLGNAYVDAMNQVKQTGCREIGLKLDSSDLEYAYWWLLGAPQNGLRLESIVTYPELERYLDPNFKPCVIICSTCGGQAQLFGLDRIGSYGDGRIKIFAGEDYDSSKP
jgi:4-amino-4-deoxy-L-arabinose transferase-like glycosyltransferase